MRDVIYERTLTRVAVYNSLELVTSRSFFLVLLILGIKYWITTAVLFFIRIHVPPYVRSGYQIYVKQMLKTGGETETFQVRFFLQNMA